MQEYDFLNIPTSCSVGNTIYKKLFYENADLSSADKALFTDNITKITWIYCLKPETINIRAYKDDIRDYPEVEVIEIEVEKETKLRRIAEIIMKTIPYPMLLFFKSENKKQIYVAHQRVNQNDKSKNIIEEFVCTDWISDDSTLLEKLNIKQMRFTNFYVLYCDILDAISVYNVSNIIPTTIAITGMEARKLKLAIETHEIEISNLRSKLKKETQFNRKMELNIKIKSLEKEINNLLGGI